MFTIYLKLALYLDTINFFRLFLWQKKFKIFKYELIAMQNTRQRFLNYIFMFEKKFKQRF